MTIRIFHSHFTGNTAVQAAQDDGGGGAYVTGAAEFSVIDSTFDNNNGSNGGALYSLVSKSVNLYDSTFSNNAATGTNGNPGNGGNGGAIGIDGGTDDDPRFLNLCRVRVLDNTSNAFGGGLFTTTYSANSFTWILNSTFDAKQHQPAVQQTRRRRLHPRQPAVDSRQYVQQQSGWRLLQGSRCSAAAAC